jgi:hypothetical protein
MPFPKFMELNLEQNVETWTMSDITAEKVELMIERYAENDTKKPE